tara:strand:+ start:2001 stop:3092 length:1092 start_codon:yes stop_codon:yes gene_type:complete
MITMLGIESSCDDTAASVVREIHGGQPLILSNEVIGQNELHQDFGGIVPEIAARAHVEKLDVVTELALENANLTLSDIDAISVTAGPGLIGGVLSGVMFAKGLAAGLSLPLIGVNHLAGHALTPRLTEQLSFPYLMLLISGGHCQFLIVKSAEEFVRLGGTIDDAPGEAFDKVAKVLCLEQPGGPSIERAAKLGDPNTFSLPRPLLERKDCNLSFSGLKTAVIRLRDNIVSEDETLSKVQQQNICASFQQAVSAVLLKKTEFAIASFKQKMGFFPKSFAVAGGVAANSEIRLKLENLCEEKNIIFSAPPIKLCTDNGAMIAWAGIELLKVGKVDNMSLKAKPRWPLDVISPPMLGSGKKGAKA